MLELLDLASLLVFELLVLVLTVTGLVWVGAGIWTCGWLLGDEWV